MAAKTYEGKIYLKSGGQSLPVQVKANSSSQAKKAIEAQYSGQFKSWSSQPREVK